MNRTIPCESRGKVSIKVVRATFTVSLSFQVGYILQPTTEREHSSPLMWRMLDLSSRARHATGCGWCVFKLVHSRTHQAGYKQNSPVVLVPQSRDATCERLPSFVGCVGATSTASSLRSAVVDRAHTEPTQAYFTGVLHRRNT